MIVELERIEARLVGKHPALVAVSAGLRKLVPNVAGVFWIAYFAVLALAFLFVFGANEARAERIKDLVTIQGIRGNQLIGYGLIVASTAAVTRPLRLRSPCRALPACWGNWE